MTKSKIVLYFCLSFISGIFLDSVITISQLLMLGFLIVGLILISVLWKYKKIVLVGFCLIFLVAGIWRNFTAELKINNNELGKYNDLREAVTLVGIVVKEPDVRTDNVKLTVEVESIHFYTSKYKSKKGSRVLVTTRRYPEYKYGDELEIKGKLKTPAVFEDFNYKDYLAKSGIFSVIYWPEIKLLSRESYRGPLSVIYVKILGFKNRLRKSIYSSLSPPQSSILGAMILGDKSRMSNDLKEKLNIAGIRHITAVSGLHVVVLSGVLMSLLIGLGFWRGQAFYISVIIIFLFIIMIGAHPSAIRAGIMGGFFLLGQKLGRKSVSNRAIMMAGAVMLAINPLLLLGDAGFQLSFLAALGIIYLSSNFKRWLRFLPEKFFNLRGILAMTFSAYLFTLPILVYNFGRVSLVTPLTNVLILPTVYWIMIFGFIFALAGIIWQPLAWILSLPCWFLLTYLVKVVNFFSHSWAAKTIENVHWLWLIGFYFVLSIFVWWLKKKERLRFLGY